MKSREEIRLEAKNILDVHAAAQQKEHDIEKSVAAAVAQLLTSVLEYPHVDNDEVRAEVAAMFKSWPETDEGVTDAAFPIYVARQMILQKVLFDPHDVGQPWDDFASRYRDMIISA